MYIYYAAYNYYGHIRSPVNTDLLGISVDAGHMSE